MKEGYVVLKQNRGLFALLWIGVIYMFFYMPISTIVICHKWLASFAFAAVARPALIIAKEAFPVS